MLSPRPSVQTDFYGQVFVLMVTERNSQSGKKVLFFFIREGYKGIRKGQQLTKNGLKYVCFCCNQISPILLTPRTCLFCCKVQCSEQKAAQTTEPCWAKSPCCLFPISHFGISYETQIQIHRSSWPDNGAVLCKEPVPTIPDFCKLSTFLLHVFHSWLASWFFPLQQIRHFLLLNWKGDPCLWGTKCRWIKFRYFRR